MYNKAVRLLIVRDWQQPKMYSKAVSLADSARLAAAISGGRDHLIRLSGC